MVAVHLIDGTYELFRCYYGAPSSVVNGREVGATRALVRSLLSWRRSGTITHAACAFDHVIESFRNDLFDGYKTGEGMDPDLYQQFELAERAVAAIGLVVWPMVAFEADDALATGAKIYAASDEVTRVYLCTPDKDLTQCVRGRRVVAFDRHRGIELDEAGVAEKFGVPPAAIADLLALVGDTADGIPGIPRWGMKSAAAVLRVYGSLEKIPKNHTEWEVKVRGAEALSESLAANLAAARLYRRLATLREDVPLVESLRDLAWSGELRDSLTRVAEELGDASLVARSQGRR